MMQLGFIQEKILIGTTPTGRSGRAGTGNPLPAAQSHRSHRAVRLRLSKTQKRELCDLVKEGPEAAGYATGCWNAALIQHMIHAKFGVMYNVQQ